MYAFAHESCMYVYLDVSAHACTYHACVAVCICVHGCMYGHRCADMHPWRCVCTGPCMQACIFSVCLYVHRHACNAHVMPVCIHACIYVCIKHVFMCIYACMHACTQLCMSVCMSAYMCACMGVAYLHVCMHECMYVGIIIESENSTPNNKTRQQTAKGRRAAFCAS